MLKLNTGGRMEKLLKELGITKIGEYSEDGSYIIDLDNSDEWGSISSLLDNNSKLDYREDSSVLNIDNSIEEYRYQNTYQLQLTADLNNNIYKLVISEI